MATKMAGSVENVTNMIQSMVGRARTAQEIELAALQEFAETRGFEDSIREFDVEFFKRKQIRSGEDNWVNVILIRIRILGSLLIKNGSG